MKGAPFFFFFSLNLTNPDYFFPRIKLSTTPGSARVDVSMSEKDAFFY